jgi:protein disulfide-isomerase
MKLFKFTNTITKNIKMSKKILVVLLAAFSLNGFAQKKDAEWHTDVNKAINISIQTGKPLFFFFTGSDWCGWCKKLQKEVFFKPEFKKWANSSVVLVEFDFNSSFRNKQKLVQQKQATFTKQEKEMLEISRSLGVRGYPTIWFVTPTIVDGKVIFDKLGSQGYVAGGPKAWTAGANKFINKK